MAAEVVEAVDLVVVEVEDLVVEEAVVVVVALVSVRIRDQSRHMLEQRLPSECRNNDQ